MAERMRVSGGEHLLAGVMFLGIIAGILLGETSPLTLSLGAIGGAPGGACP